MASLALGVAGAIIGSFFGPLGASIGWAIGSAIGAGIGQKGTEGPRLTDLKLQTSAYGSPIPILYGTIRVAGASVIWQSDLVEHKSTSSGKGGSRQTTTTFTYSASFAIMLCQTSYIGAGGALQGSPILGILRIWADNRLIWQNGVRTDSGPALPLTIYYGTDTQLPDPTMQAALGAANVPAHRGFAYVVFSNMDLSEFYNRIPNLTFEVHATGAIQLQQYATWDVDWNLHGDHSTYSYPSLLNGQSYNPVTKILTEYQWRSAEDYGGTRGIINYAQRTYTLQGSLQSQTSSTFTELPPSGVPGMSNPFSIIGSSNSAHFIRNFQFATLACVYCDGNLPVRFLSTSEWTPAALGVGWPTCVLCEAGGGYPSGAGLSLGINGTMFYSNGYLYATGGGLNDDPNFGGPGIWVSRWPVNGNGEVASQGPDKTFLLRPTSFGPGPYGRVDAQSADVTVSDDGYVYVMCSASLDAKNLLFKLTLDLQLVYAWNPFPIVSTPGRNSFTVFQGYLLLQANSNVGFTPTILNPGMFLYKINSDYSFTFTSYLFGTPSPPAGIPSPVISLGGGFAAWRGGILSLGGQTTYAAIVTDISQRVGLTTSDIDVTDIPEVCRGFAVGQQMTARAAIESLMPADLFDGVESDLKAKFVKRGKHPSVGVIPNNDLGARKKGSAPVPMIAPTRKDESQLPRRIYVKYFDIDANYQDGTQIAQRVVTSSELDVTINIPVVLTGTEAKYIAEVLLASAWAERDTFEVVTPLKWVYLDPTDVFSPQQLDMRITQQSIEDDVIKYQCAGTVGTVFIQQPVPVPPQIVPKPIPNTPSVQPTELLLLDIPLVTDVDQPNGYYAAMAGALTTAWPGAQLYKSLDNGNTYTVAATAVAADTIGETTTTLGNFTGGNVFDEINTVTVLIHAGGASVPSGTSEIGVLNGANMALVGSEIIQFKNVVMNNGPLDPLGKVTSVTYTLSGLLRGRRGTDWAMNTHIGGEPFVLLPVNTNVPGPFSELSVSELYEPVTVGQTLAAAKVYTFQNTGVALTPYSPVNIGGGRNGAGDITINWNRRTRIGGTWKDFVDAPVSETQESFALEVYSDGTFTNALFLANVSVETYTFTAAQQTTYFGSLQSVLYVSVQQRGSYQIGKQARGSV